MDEAPAAAARGEPLLDRLDLFFSNGVITDTVRDFFSDNEECLRQLREWDGNTDSEAAIRSYHAFKAYSTLLESIIEKFLAADAAEDGQPVTEAALAETVMSEWNRNSFTYTCTAYLAAALDFNAFIELASDMLDLHCFSYEEMEEEEEEDSHDDGREVENDKRNTVAP